MYVLAKSEVNIEWEIIGGYITNLYVLDCDILEKYSKLVPKATFVALKRKNILKFVAVV